MRQLKGIRVLDLGTVITKPLAGLIRADLGADVIKVEKPQGGTPSTVFAAASIPTIFCHWGIRAAGVSRAFR